MADLERDYDYKEDEDPKTYKSEKTGRGPLDSPDWRDQVQPVMTCYKLVTVEFKWWGLQASEVYKKKDDLFNICQFLFLNIQI